MGHVREDGMVLAGLVMAAGCADKDPDESPPDGTTTDSSSPTNSPTDLPPDGSGNTGTTGDTAPPTDSGVLPGLWDGEYAGTVAVDVEIQPYSYVTIPASCTGPLTLTVDAAAEPPISGELECTFVVSGYVVAAPGQLRGALTVDPAAAGQILVGKTGGGYVPLVDGGWQGTFVADPVSGEATLDATFVGDLTVKGTHVSWDGTFSATRTGPTSAIATGSPP
jgi:hypothetical protein